MNKDTIRQIYLELIDDIEDCVDFDTDVKLLRNSKGILLICTGDFGSVNAFMKILNQEISDDSKLAIAGQKSIENSLKAIVDSEYEFIGWKGRYNLEFGQLIKDSVDTSLIDTVVFLSRCPLDTRDKNVFEIINLISKDRRLKVFNFTISGMLDEFKGLDKYMSCINMAEAMYEYVHNCIAGE